jgi:hypothetical protein
VFREFFEKSIVFKILNLFQHPVCENVGKHVLRIVNRRIHYILKKTINATMYCMHEKEVITNLPEDELKSLYFVTSHRCAKINNCFPLDC